MATFYLLPPRTCLEQAFGELLARLLPGLPLPVESWEAITDRIGSAANWPDDVFLVPRDDLPEGDPVGESLAAAFGAEPGDRVVEVSLARGPSAARAWVLPASGVPRVPAAL
jgi:hypothetical protein